VTKTDLNKSWLFVTGKVNLKGEPIIELSGHFENGTDLSISFERYGVHKDGKELIPNSYLELSYWGQDKYIAKKDDKYGLISIDNKILLPFEYQSIEPLSDNRSIVKKGLSTYKIDANLSVVDDETINLEDGFKKVKMAGKWGIVNPQGDVIVDYKYDEITTFRGRLIGIINGKLVKLSAYYPHRLQMYGVNDSGVANKDIVKVSSLQFQLIPKRSDAKSGASVKVALVNLTSMMKYPIVQIFNNATKGKKAKHIDKPDDFTIGETYLATISSFIFIKHNKNKASNGKIKGVDVKIGESSISHVYKSAFAKANISLDSIHVGDKLELIKHGYDDELDRTIWEVKVVSE
jgi:hypothetical protein